MKILSNAEYNRLLEAIDEKKGYISEREAKYLQGEIVFWRDKYEVERERTDRAVDTLVEGTGALPISDLGIKKVRDNRTAADKLFEKQQREVSEIYSETINEFESIETGDVSYESDPESTTEIPE